MLASPKPVVAAVTLPPAGLELNIALRQYYVALSLHTFPWPTNYVHCEVFPRPFANMFQHHGRWITDHIAVSGIFVPYTGLPSTHAICFVA